MVKASGGKRKCLPPPTLESGPQSRHGESFGWEAKVSASSDPGKRASVQKFTRRSRKGASGGVTTSPHQSY
ncbi:unnamed protein product [Cuscuta campestris]|uniref:Uncharacterized protein n=1 Tax=Cuscuta campestris TaxID=132261 RepID=A0A484L0S1_9ASTE|nr:unnamed protein product [Cuscuta campestris]